MNRACGREGISHPLSENATPIRPFLTQVRAKPPLSSSRSTFDVLVASWTSALLPFLRRDVLVANAHWLIPFNPAYRWSGGRVFHFRPSGVGLLEVMRRQLSSRKIRRRARECAPAAILGFRIPTRLSCAVR